VIGLDTGDLRHIPPKMIENGQKTLENASKLSMKCRFWEITAIATHENEERLLIQ